MHYSPPVKRNFANAVTLAKFVALESLLLLQNLSRNSAVLLLLVHFAVSNLILRKCVSSIPNNGYAFKIRTVAVNLVRESWGFVLAPMLPAFFAIVGIGEFGKPVVAALIFGEGLLFCCFEGLALGMAVGTRAECRTRKGKHFDKNRRALIAAVLL